MSENIPTGSNNVDPRYTAAEFLEGDQYGSPAQQSNSPSTASQGATMDKDLNLQPSANYHECGATTSPNNT